MVPNTPTTHVDVPIQQTQIQPSLIANPIPVNQHVGWSQLVTPLIARQPRTVPHPMWYNIVPSFVPMDPNLYPMYYLVIKRPDPLISRRKKGFAVYVAQPQQAPLVEQLV
jgi:hypothetical protein